MGMFKEVEARGKFKDKNEDYIRYFETITLDHND
jgi:hypothetical protein